MITGALSRFNFKYDNLGANPSSSPGISVIPGATNAEGAWTQIASAANISQNIYAFWLRVSDGFTSAAIKNHLLDIGVDPAGGTAYTAIISNIVCGESTSFSNGGGPEFLLPHFIKSGSSVAARIQGSNGTAGTVRVGAVFYGQPSRPENMPVGQYSETIGAITNSEGVAFTPGNAVDGTWVLLGATTRNLWWWNIAHQLSNATITLERTYIEISHGDATNKHVIMRRMHIGNTTEDVGSGLEDNLNAYAAYCPVKAGTNIYIRGRADSVADTGYNGVAIGIG